MSFSSALYYPWIEVRDERWLRSACLYWEKIHTIVPASIRSPYTGRISRHLCDAGILDPLRVSSNHREIEALAGDVIAFLDSDEANGLLMGGGPQRVTPIHRDKWPELLGGRARLHNQKFAYELRRRIEAYSRFDGEWIEMDDVFADFYMTLLANRLAKKKGLGLLTSSFEADRLASSARAGRRAWARDRGLWPSGAPQRAVAESVVVDLLIGDLSIAPNVSLGTLLKFREQHADELGRFRAKVGQLTASIPGAESLEAARQQAHDLVVNEVRPAIADLKGALKGSRIKTLNDGLLKVSLASVAQGSALTLAGLSMPISLLVGAGLSLTALAVQHHEERKKLKRENAFSYLLSIEKKFS